MSIAHDLRAALLAEPTINVLTEDVYRNDVPEIAPATPYIRIQRDRTNDDLTHDGYGLLTESVFSVDCVGPTQGEADDLADAVKTYLQSFNALVQSQNPTMGDSTIRGVFVRDKADDYEPFPEASDRVIPWASMDAEIWHV